MTIIKPHAMKARISKSVATKKTHHARFLDVRWVKTIRVKEFGREFKIPPGFRLNIYDQTMSDERGNIIRVI